MDLEKLLWAEHSKRQCDRIVAYVGDDKDRFAQLIELFFRGEYRITQRAAWPLSYCVRRHPELITPYYRQLLDNLRRKNIHVAVIRNTVRLLQDVSIPKRWHGRVMSICFEFVEDPATPIAVKAFALSILSNLSAEYPEIKGELKTLIESQWEQATPAFRSRARKILKGL
jgi:hypothetical protein